MLDWPISFNAAVDAVRDGESSRSGKFGKRKAFGAFAQLSIDRAIHPKLRVLVNDELERRLVSSHTVRPKVADIDKRYDGDVVPICIAASVLKISRRRISGLVREEKINGHKSADAANASVLVSISQLATLVGNNAAQISVESVAGTLGMPGLAVQSLVDAGFLRGRMQCEPHAIANSVQRDSLGVLIMNLNSRVSSHPKSPYSISLLQAAVLLGSPQHNPWPNLVTMILTDKASLWATSQQGPLSSRMQISFSGPMDFALDPTHPWKIDDDPILSHQDAHRLLGTNPRTLYALLRAEELPRQIRLSDVQSFSAAQVLTGELLCRLRLRGVQTLGQVVARLLRYEGLNPTFEKPGQHGLRAWPRIQAEAAMERILSRPGVFRRPFGSGDAAMAGSSSTAQ